MCMCVNLGACRGQWLWILPELESRVVVELLMWVLGTKSGFSARAKHAVPSAQPQTVEYKQPYTPSHRMLFPVLEITKPDCIGVTVRQVFSNTGLFGKPETLAYHWVQPRGSPLFPLEKEPSEVFFEAACSFCKFWSWGLFFLKGKSLALRVVNTRCGIGEFSC